MKIRKPACYLTLLGWDGILSIALHNTWDTNLNVLIKGLSSKVTTAHCLRLPRRRYRSTESYRNSPRIAQRPRNTYPECFPYALALLLMHSSHFCSGPETSSCSMHLLFSLKSGCPPSKQTSLKKKLGRAETELCGPYGLIVHQAVNRLNPRGGGVFLRLSMRLVMS